MKKRITKLLVVAFAMFAFTTGAFAQGVTASATASATIITPISILKTVDMNFGNVAVNASLGTVVLTPAGTRSVTGGCTLPATAGTVTAASFTVSGLADATYAITLPAGATTITDGTNNMTVDTWTSTPTPTGVLTGGTQTLTVGATLHVGASQVPNTYVSGTPFDVTVNYN